MNFGGNPNVPGLFRSPIFQNYAIVVGGLVDNSRVYFKFYLDYPGGPNIPPGNYINNLQFKVVPEGDPPP